jgi:repressor LexA
MTLLTKKQQAVYDFIVDYINTNSYPPSMREICDALNISSTNGVNDHINKLCAKGYLEKQPNMSRSLRIVNPPPHERLVSYREFPIKNNSSSQNAVSVPLIGKVTAGNFALAIQSSEEHFDLDLFFLQNQRQSFALKIMGDSMIGAGINDGDIVFVKNVNHANNGDIVIVLVGEEATCKRYFLEKDHVRLQPENSRLKPILIDKNAVQQPSILGVVTGLYRAVY